MENRYKLMIDLKSRVLSNIKFKQGDTDSSVLDISVINNGQPVDITGQAIEFNFLKPDGNIVIQDSTTGVSITNAAAGNFQCILKNQTLAVSGTVSCEIVFKQSGKILSTTTFNFTVDKSIGNGDGILSSNYIGSIDGLLLTISTAEDIRIASENDRLTNETDRLASEVTRVSNETARLASEVTRLTNETSRLNQEALRVLAENLRVTAETARVTAETLRLSNEASRIGVEANRVTAETSRATAESSRVTVESARVAAESARVTAEAARVTLNATNNANLVTATTNLTNNTLIIYKPSVATFSAIATTYSSGVQNGWTVQCVDTMHRWRYNGSAWIDLGVYTDNTSVVISANQPALPTVNPVWVKQIVV